MKLPKIKYFLTISKNAFIADSIYYSGIKFRLHSNLHGLYACEAKTYFVLFSVTLFLLLFFLLKIAKPGNCKTILLFFN